MLLFPSHVPSGPLILHPLFSSDVAQTPEELEDDSDFEQEDYDTRSRTSVQTEDDQLIAGQSARVSRRTLDQMKTLW